MTAISAFCLPSLVILCLLSLFQLIVLTLPFPAKMQTDPEALKVREWRHRLQKAFLSSKTTPEETVRYLLSLPFLLLRCSLCARVLSIIGFLLRFWVPTITLTLATNISFFLIAFSFDSITWFVGCVLLEALYLFFILPWMVLCVVRWRRCAFSGFAASPNPSDFSFFGLGLCAPRCSSTAPGPCFLCYAFRSSPLGFVIWASFIFLAFFSLR